MPITARVNRRRAFILTGCVLGTEAAYAALAGLHVAVAPIPEDVAVVAWTAPLVAVGGLAGCLLLGPECLLSYAQRRRA